MPYGPPEGFGGIGSGPGDWNLKGIGPYDNTMIPGNPLASFQASCPIASGYCEPGLEAEPFGLFLGAAVSGLGSSPPVVHALQFNAAGNSMYLPRHSRKGRCHEKSCSSSLFLLLLASGAHATCPTPLVILDGQSASQNMSIGLDPGGNCLTSFGNSASITNPTSTLTLPGTTTAYAPGELMASSATAGSVVVPSFAIPNSAGGFYLPGLILTSNDTASTAYPGTIVQIDLWRVAPTFTNGNLGAYAVATGAAGYARLIQLHAHPGRRRSL